MKTFLILQDNGYDPDGNIGVIQALTENDAKYELQSISEEDWNNTIGDHLDTMDKARYYNVRMSLDLVEIPFFDTL